MVQEWLTKGVFLYLMAGICGAGVLLKIVLTSYFDRQLRLTKEMGTATKKWLLRMREDYGKCVDARGKLNNVDVFVDKYIEGKKFMGIMLSTWDKISGQAWILCAGLLVISALSGIFYEVDKEAILFTFFIGIWTIIVDIVVDNVAGLAERKEQLKRNLKDYFENRAVLMPELKESTENVPEEQEEETALAQKSRRKFSIHTSAAQQKRECLKRELQQEIAQEPEAETKNQKTSEEPYTEEKKMPSREALEQLAAAFEKLKRESLAETETLSAEAIEREQENGALIEEVLREFLV